MSDAPQQEPPTGDTPPAAWPPGGPPPPERPLPRGCHPLVFGVIAATLQMAVILWALSRCR